MSIKKLEELCGLILKKGEKNKLLDICIKYGIPVSDTSLFFNNNHYSSWGIEKNGVKLIGDKVMSFLKSHNYKVFESLEELEMYLVQDAKEKQLINRINKQHQVINDFLKMVVNKNVLIFKEYCHENLDIIGLYDFFFCTLKLNETLINYVIHSNNNFLDDIVMITLNTKKNKVTLKIVFNTDDKVIGIWVVEFSNNCD